ncbi:MAG TPA: P1 family peptidase [Herpetosiphonaceae bacterium]|nr:P1 family peptidase [Herpetosiphonaceae bacterium]
MNLLSPHRELPPGLSVGHADSESGHTGCTVVLCPAGAVAGIAVRGGAPGTRETDLLRSENWVNRVHAVLLTGGSAFGLSAADGVVRWLREAGSGWSTRAGPVPIVTAAVLFDLDPAAPEWPDAALGYAACGAASNSWPAEGRVGAGRGATVGKVLGIQAASPGGIGAASQRLDDGTTVGAIVAVNALGHIVHPASNTILAGPHLAEGGFGDSVALVLDGAIHPPETTNTTIGVIWTDAALDKAGCNRIADVAHDGLARVIRPAHTQHDGDTLFLLALPAPSARVVRDVTTLGVAATEVVAAAIVRAVTRLETRTTV